MGLTRADREDFEAKLKAVWKPEIERCKVLPDFYDRLACMSEIVYGITESQDVANLTVRGMFYSEDPEVSKDRRWEAIHLLDDANAVFLGVSEARYDPEYFTREGDYVNDKMGSLINRWRRIKEMKEAPAGYLLPGETEADWREKVWHLRTEEEREASRLKMDRDSPRWRKFI